MIVVNYILAFCKDSAKNGFSVHMRNYYNIFFLCCMLARNKLLVYICNTESVAYAAWPAVGNAESKIYYGLATPTHLTITLLCIA